MMLPEDLERWQRYLTPGIHDTAPSTDHTDRELLRELVDQQLDSMLQDELTESREELTASENQVDSFRSQVEELRTLVNDLEDVLVSNDLQDAFNKVSKAVQRIQDA